MMGSDNHTLAAAKAAYENADFAGAAYHLACMYDRDRGVFVDTSKCIYWLKRAAELGHVMAMYELAVCHDSGVRSPEHLPRRSPHPECPPNAPRSARALRGRSSLA